MSNSEGLDESNKELLAAMYSVGSFSNLLFFESKFIQYLSLSPSDDLISDSNSPFETGFLMTY